MIEIEKAVPIPDIGAGRRLFYPFSNMEIGDSFFIECSNENLRKAQINIHSSGRRNKPKKFLTRKVEGGVRCWRTE